MSITWHVEENDYDSHSCIGVFNKASLAHAFVKKLRVTLAKSTRPGRKYKNRVTAYHREAWYFAYGTWHIITQCRLAGDNVFRKTLYVRKYVGVDTVPLVRRCISKTMRGY